ncbi:MAG: hypothetical protein D6739_08385 [Nitrospirae bacterium]|nr:MAG: hypothetical protein D6739_08385 [Nitrospirota bacterium]
MKTLVLTATAGLLFAACAGHTPAANPDTGATGPTPKWAQEVGKPQVPPPPVEFQAPEPGEAKPLPRAYQGAPPQIPHDTSDMAITGDENPCIGCHTTEPGAKKVAGEAPPVPQSHFVDDYQRNYNRDARRGVQTYRQAKIAAAHGLLGARYLCTQCHVPQAKVKPWVESTFSAR